MLDPVPRICRPNHARHSTNKACGQPDKWFCSERILLMHLITVEWPLMSLNQDEFDLQLGGSTAKQVGYIAGCGCSRAFQLSSYPSPAQMSTLRTQFNLSFPLLAYCTLLNPHSNANLVVYMCSTHSTTCQYWWFNQEGFARWPTCGYGIRKNIKTAKAFTPNQHSSWN